VCLKLPISCWHILLTLFSTMYEWEHVLHSQSWVKWTTLSCYWGVYVIKQSNTWLLKDMEFLFFCSTQYLTCLLCCFLRYPVDHSKRNNFPYLHTLCVILCLITRTQKENCMWKGSLFIVGCFSFLTEKQIIVVSVKCRTF